MARGINSLLTTALRPVDGASLVALRRIFGILCLITVIRFFAHGWIDALYIAPAHHFTYPGFGWVHPWPGWGMYAHFAALALASAGIIIGWRPRLCAALFGIGLAYVELLDRTNYLNHYYLMTLVSLLLAILPHPKNAGAVPRRTLWTHLKAAGALPQRTFWKHIKDAAAALMQTLWPHRQAAGTVPQRILWTHLKDAGAAPMRALWTHRKDAGTVPQWTLWPHRQAAAAAPQRTLWTHLKNASSVPMRTFWPHRQAAAAVPQWTIWTLRFQVGIVYAFAGIAKLNPDWLQHALPLRIWLYQHGDFPILGPTLQQPAAAYALSWAGAIFDLAIVPALLWRRTRAPAYGVLAAFHISTSLLFPHLGIFPWLMMGLALIYFAPNWPRQLQEHLPRLLRPRPASAEIPPSEKSAPTSTPAVGKVSPASGSAQPTDSGGIPPVAGSAQTTAVGKVPPAQGSLPGVLAHIELAQQAGDGVPPAQGLLRITDSAGLTPAQGRSQTTAGGKLTQAERSAQTTDCVGLTPAVGSAQTTDSGKVTPAAGCPQTTASTGLTPAKESAQPTDGGGVTPAQGLARTADGGGATPAQGPVRVTAGGGATPAQGPVRVTASAGAAPAQGPVRITAGAGATPAQGPVRITAGAGATPAQGPVRITAGAGMPPAKVSPPTTASPGLTPAKGSPPTTASGKLSRAARIGAAALALYIALQLAMPLRHYAYPGNVRWNEAGYLFAWRVMLTEKTGFIRFRVQDPTTGQTWQIAPEAYLTPLQTERMAIQPELIRQTAAIIRNDFAGRGYDGVTITADAFVSYNGRPAARLIDPNANLAAVPPAPAPAKWVLPHDAPPPGRRPR